MKRVMCFLVATVVTFTWAVAQTPCPEFANSVSAVSADGSGLVELEVASATVKQKKKGLYGGFNNSVRLEGSKSSVKIKSGSSFVFRPYDKAMRPEQQIKLYLFDSSKDFRELATGGTNVFGGSKNKKSQDTSIPLQFEKISDGCYKVTLSKKLPAGEYAFSLGTNASVQGQSAGFGSSSGGQAWYAFKI